MPARAFAPADLPVVVAHRGASSTHPENTLPSFEAAIRIGAHAIESDVRVSADGVPVMMHDADVARTTDGKGLVSQLSIDELRGLDAGGGAPVPTLAEVLRLASGRAAVCLEIKNLPGEPGFDPDREAEVEATLAALDASGFVGPALVLSFNPRSLLRCRELASEVPTGLLTTSWISPPAALDAVTEVGHQWLLPAADALLGAGTAFVEAAHAAGVRVGTWTVDDAGTARTLFGMGVDAVASNDPASVLPALSEVSAG